MMADLPYNKMTPQLVRLLDSGVLEKKIDGFIRIHPGYSKELERGCKRLGLEVTGNGSTYTFHQQPLAKIKRLLEDNPPYMISVSAAQKLSPS